MEVLNAVGHRNRYHGRCRSRLGPIPTTRQRLGTTCCSSLLALVIVASAMALSSTISSDMAGMARLGRLSQISKARYLLPGGFMSGLNNQGLSNLIVQRSACTAKEGTQLEVPQQETVQLDQTPQVYKVLDPKIGPSVMEGITTIIMDQDGVLWRGNTVFPSTLPSLKKFKELGIRVLFVTNNAAKSRQQYVEKWRKVGLEITKDEIVPASFMAAAYLQSINFSGRVFLIGDEGTRLELEEHGFEAVECDQDKTTMSNEELSRFEPDPEVKAVVLAHDPNFNYRKLAIATQYLRNNPNCKFIVTNMDAGDMLDNNRFMPGTGGMADAITTITGRTPINTGKGGDFMLPFLMKKYGVDPSEMMCVGDRLDTDIALGRQANCKTAMPFTGVTSKEILSKTSPEKQPTYVMDNLGVLAGLDYVLAM